MSFIDELFEEGKKIGIEKGIKTSILIIKHWQKGTDLHMIANLTGLSLEQVKKVIADFESNT